LIPEGRTEGGMINGRFDACGRGWCCVGETGYVICMDVGEDKKKERTIQWSSCKRVKIINKWSIPIKKVGKIQI
jgi:hypothetical protein